MIFQPRLRPKYPFLIRFNPETKAIPANSAGVADLTNAEFDVIAHKEGKEVLPNFDESLGGRNLILNSDFSKGVTDWNTQQTLSFEVVDDVRFKHVLNFTADRDVGIWQLQRLPVNQNYTLSAWVKSNIKSAPFYLAIDGAGTQRAEAFPIGLEWERLTATFTSSGINTNPRLYGKGSFSIAQIKLEEGTIATPYIPAPEDILSTSIINTSNCYAVVVDNHVKITTITPNKQSGWVDVTVSYGEGFTATKRFTWILKIVN